MTTNFINLLSHPQLRQTVIEQLHHGTICMISMTCKELFQSHKEENRTLKVRLKHDSSSDGECIESISMIKYINHPIDDTLVSTMAAAGSISIISYCFDKGVQMLENLTDITAANGQIEILNYLLDNGCPWNKNLLEIPSIQKSYHSLVHSINNPLKRLWYKYVKFRFAFKE